MAVVANNSSGGKIKRNENRAVTTPTAATITTFTAASTIHPHELGRDLIPELAMRVYSSQLDSFREAISNAFDENSHKVVLTLLTNKIIIEDWGNGIKDYDEFRKFGQATKREMQGEIIGEKGLGKLSLLNLGSLICFETNNGKVAMKFNMTLNGFSNPVYKKNSAAFLAHKGTRITITKLTNRPHIEELATYLKKAFGLRLAQGTEIIINKQPLQPRSNLDPTEEVLFQLTQTINARNVTGNLKASEDGKGIVDLYIDHVFVTSIEVDTRRKFVGWVNCNVLTPETSRNNIVQNAVYREFIRLLRQYTSRFPLREISIDEHKLTLNRELNILLKNYLKDMRVSVQAGLIDNDNIDRDTDNKPPPVFQRLRTTNNSTAEKSQNAISIGNKALEEEARLADKTHQERNSENVTVKWEFTDLGNEKEPIYFVPPNIIYCNISNDLYKFAMQKNRNYGPTWIRMLPYLARIAVAMGSNSSRLTADQLNIQVDQATRYFLRQKKAL